MNERYTALVYGFIFQGEQIVSPAQLMESDTQTGFQMSFPCKHYRWKWIIFSGKGKDIGTGRDKKRNSVGINRKLTEVVCKKLKRGKTPEIIAEELEQVQSICKAAARLNEAITSHEK